MNKIKFKQIIDCRLDRYAQHKTAFTLAEVLVTLSILGVVAAISIPNMVQKYRNTVSLTRLKKTYAKITNSIEEAMVVNYCDSMGCVLQKTDAVYDNQNSTNFPDRQLKALKVFFPDIRLDNTYSCVPKRVYDLSNNEQNITTYAGQSLYLMRNEHYFPYCLKDNTGLLIGVDSLSTKISTYCFQKGGSSCMRAYIYTGTNKNKAIIGRDLFYLYLFGNNEVILNLAAECNPAIEGAATGYPNGAACLQRIIKNSWKIDY